MQITTLRVIYKPLWKFQFIGIICIFCYKKREESVSSSTGNSRLIFDAYDLQIFCAQGIQFPRVEIQGKELNMSEKVTVRTRKLGTCL